MWRLNANDVRGAASSDAGWDFEGFEDTWKIKGDNVLDNMKDSRPTPPQEKSAKSSALTSVVYPVLSKLLKTNQEDDIVAALAQLKLALDGAEKAKPGLTHSLIAQIIETLKSTKK